MQSMGKCPCCGMYGDGWHRGLCGNLTSQTSENKGCKYCHFYRSSRICREGRWGWKCDKCHGYTFDGENKGDSKVDLTNIRPLEEKIFQLAELIKELSCMVGTDGHKYLEDRLKSIYERANEIQSPSGPPYNQGL